MFEGIDICNVNSKKEKKHKAWVKCIQKVIVKAVWFRV